MWPLLTSQLHPVLFPHILLSINSVSHLLILHMLLSFAWKVFPSPIKPNKHLFTLILQLERYTSLLHLLRCPTVFLPPALMHISSRLSSISLFYHILSLLLDWDSPKGGTFLYC